MYLASHKSQDLNIPRTVNYLVIAHAFNSHHTNNPPPSFRTMRAVHLLLLTICIVTSQAVRLPVLDESVDHQAHAKPGGPYHAVDWDLDGMEPIKIDATQSHTHFFDHGPPPSSGKIVKYEWYSVTTNKSLLQTSSPYMSANFFLGITILRLVVTDSTGDQADAFTYVNVREPIPGENQKPVVESMEPEKATMSGGTLVTVHGSGFYNNVQVYLGETRITPVILDDHKLRIRTPPVETPRNVSLFVTTGFGTSAADITFQYEESGTPPVKFKAKFMKNSDGKELYIPEVTVLKLGPDGRYYAGTLDGYVRVFSADRSMTVTSMCTSENVGSGRSVLGLAFHPNEQKPLAVYLSTSSLAWHKKNTNDDWDNGKIEVWSKQHDRECLSHARTLITGLPVSKGDHGVNGMVFLNDGSLLVAVGGTTNAGVHTDGDNLGGVPESPFSGSIVRINTISASFDGSIKYAGRVDPGTATVSSGTAEVYASGLRNVYGITLHSNGKVYAMDNGPNMGKGYGASGCNTIGKQEEFRDKLVLVKEGAYYGHPNWNRGRFDKRECTFIRGDSPPKPGYTTPLAILGSSTNGIIEYTANSFGSQLRGYLILSKMSWDVSGLLKVAKPDETGEELVEAPFEVYADSGLTLEMGPFGELLMPKIKQAKILVLVPDEPSVHDLHVICVTPRRGPALGGNEVLVTGSGFAKGMKVFIGDKECTAYGDVADDGSSITCIVPPYISGERKLSVVAEVDGFESKPSGQGEYQYMEL